MHVYVDLHIMIEWASKHFILKWTTHEQQQQQSTKKYRRNKQKNCSSCSCLFSSFTLFPFIFRLFIGNEWNKTKIKKKIDNNHNHTLMYTIDIWLSTTFKYMDLFLSPPDDKQETTTINKKRDIWQWGRFSVLIANGYI